MAVGTVRTITRSVTVPANGVQAFAASAAALPATHVFLRVEVVDPGVDLVSFTVNGLPCRFITPNDKVCASFSNSTGAPITTNVIVTLVEIGAVPSV